jgi:hypothetical protein
MPLLKLLWYYLWIAPHILQIGIAGIMLRRNLVRTFPWFFAYTCLEVTDFVVLFGLTKFEMGRYLYFSAYSVTSVLSTALHFAIILEVLRELTSSYAVLERVVRPLFRWVAISLVIAALALAVYTKGDYSDHAWYVLNMLDRTALILQTGLLAAIFLFSRYMALSWRNQVFGIALGLGLYAFVELVAAAVSAQKGFKYAETLDYFIMAMFHGSVLLWMFYLWAPEPSRNSDLPNLPAHHEVEDWNQELDRLLHQ